MGEMKQRMLSGEPYRDDDGELLAERLACRRALDEFNGAPADDEERRTAILKSLLGSLGERTCVMPPLRCDYGAQVHVGDDSFLNYDAILLDCARITIGSSVFIGPRAQLLTALHPMDDHAARRAGWESAAPVTIGDGVWLGAGVIVCPGVRIGQDSVIGAGSVVTRDVPARVFAAGNPCRVIRSLEGEAQA
ncbi:sugar O-acetyltransferase [Tomitella gaofuii]|uniref:sugar O-acetyltransferase n=1 Tax=Tomitella gaofuii TaxID=2760083 RepID=UPI0015F9933F|nr:sugar O-acetyltransferase [Tomitella gaofuii]